MKRFFGALWALRNGKSNGAPSVCSNDIDLVIRNKEQNAD
jgi:hypothetical protein